MSVNDFFSDDEIENLRLSAMRVFNLIAGADNKIDKKELKAFEYFIKHSKTLDSSIAAEIFRSISDINLLEEKRKSSGISDREGLRYIDALLERKAGHEAAVDFKITLIAFGYFIANASGSFFSSKVSDDEAAELNLISMDLDLSLRELMSTNNIQKVLDKLEE